MTDLLLRAVLASGALLFGSPSICQTGAVQEPIVKSPQLPSYSPLARAACVQGSVAVVVEISEQGQVTATDILYGHTLLRQTAETAARNWLFEPRSTEAREVLRFTFRIMPFETPAKRLKPVFTRSTDVEIRVYPYEPSCTHCSPKRLKELRKGGCPPIR
jgi:TonB family protein